MSKKDKIDSLQTLRTLAFLGIFTSHAMWNTQYGAWGVSVFFVLSGFLMIYNYWDRELGTSVKELFTFSVSKISKLYLLHLITLIMGIPFEVNRSLTNGTSESIYYFKKIIASITLIQSWFPDFWIYGSFNGVAWFLSACFFFYFMFPLFLRLFKTIRKTWMFIILAVIIYAVQITFLYFTRGTAFSTYPDTNYWIAYTFPLVRLGDFIEGALIGCIYISTDRVKGINPLFSISEIVTFVLIYMCGRLYENSNSFFGQNWFRYTCLWIPTSLLIVYLFAINRGILSKVLTNKPMVYFGELCQYTFLIHSLTIIYCRQYVSDFFSRYMQFRFENFSLGLKLMKSGDVYKFITTFIALSITFLLSYLWKLFEDNRKIRRRIKE